MSNQWRLPAMGSQDAFCLIAWYWLNMRYEYTHQVLHGWSCRNIKSKHYGLFISVNSSSWKLKITAPNLRCNVYMLEMFDIRINRLWQKRMIKNIHRHPNPSSRPHISVSFSHNIQQMYAFPCISGNCCHMKFSIILLSAYQGWRNATSWCYWEYLTWVSVYFCGS